MTCITPRKPCQVGVIVNYHNQSKGKQKKHDTEVKSKKIFKERMGISRMGKFKNTRLARDLLGLE